MKKYLLTVFGNFELEQCEEIAHCLEALVDSPHLKFQYQPAAGDLQKTDPGRM